MTPVDEPLGRREFLKASAGLVVAAAASSCGPGRGEPRPPNILYVLSDSHRAGDLGCYGNPQARTPSFDAFAAEGLRLLTAVSSTPLCRPYRASLMTGAYPHRTGMLANKSERNFAIERGYQWMPRGVDLLGEHFAAAGYRCGYVGKWHLGSVNTDPGPLRFGFDDDWAAASGDAHDYYEWAYSTGKGQSTDGTGFRATVETDLALEFVREAREDADRPWLMFLSWGPPHDPYKPPPGFVRNEPVSIRPNVPRVAETRRRIARALKGYHGLIEAIDHEFGRLVAGLHELGLAEDTIVIYTSDHGNLLGTHGYIGKEMPYAESTSVPFLIRWPGHIPVATLSMPFGTPDIFPSLAGLANLQRPADTDGHDFSRSLLGLPDAPVQDQTFLVSHTSRFIDWPGWRGVRTERHLYACRQQGPWMLYDLVEDPFELNNLVGKRLDLQRDLDGRMRSLMDSVGDTWRGV